MPTGVYERTPEMKTGKFERTPEHSAAIKKGMENSAAVKAWRGIPHSPEHNAAVSDGMKNSDAVKAYADARLGVSRPPETCAAISTMKTGIPQSPEHIAALEPHWENMRGGDDIVWHHTLYDHSDLSLNRVAMTRRNHGMGHRVLQTLGIKIPHINVNPERAE